MSRSMCRSCSARCWRARAAARRAVRRLHARARRAHARAARRGRDTRDRAGPRPLGAGGRGDAAGGVWRARRVRARRLPAACRRCSTARGVERVQGVLADLGVSSMQFDSRGPRVQFQARRAARHADGPEHGADGGRPGESGRRGRTGQRDLPSSARSGTRAASAARWWRRGPSPRRANWPRSCGARCRRRAGSGSIRRRARFRRCGSGSTASWTGSIASSRTRRTGSSQAGGWR